MLPFLIYKQWAYKMTPAERKKYLRKKYYWENRERCLEQNRIWAKEHKDKANRDENKIRAARKKYYQSEKGKTLKKKINKERNQLLILARLWGEKEIKEIYQVCKLLNMFRFTKLSVDHVIPLKGKDICGLHVPENLRIILSVQNDQKGNKWLPSQTGG